MDSPPRHRFLHALLHPDLRAALLEALCAPAADDAPPVLVVPNAAIGRDVVRGHAQRAGRSWNVRTLTWIDLALELTARERGLERRRLLGAEARAWLLQRLQVDRHRSRTSFDSVLGMRGFRLALGRSFEELARAGLVTCAEIERLLVRHGFEMPLQVRHALDLYLAYRRSFEATHDDPASLVARAATVPDGRCAAVLGRRVWIYGFADLSGLERRLLAHLASDPGLELRVFVARAPRTSPRLADWLGGLGFEPDRSAVPASPAPPAELRVVSAPSAESEAEEIARQILAAVDDGMRFGGMAVVVRGAQRLDLLRAVLRRRGIPCTFQPGPPLRATRTGRALLFFFDLLGLRFEPGPVLAFLAVAPLRVREWAGIECETAASGWERVARQTFLGRGIEDWGPKLERYRDEQQTAAERADEQGEPAQRARAAARGAAELAAIATALDRELREFPERGRWSDFVAATVALLDRVFEANPESDALRAALGRLQALDGLGGGPSRSEYHDAVRDLLGEAVHDPEGAPGARVQVGTAAALHGLPFDLVCVAGVQEGEWPGRPPHDPVLRDRERASLEAILPEGVELGSPDNLVERERWLFRTACAAARRRVVVSYARLDPVNGAECLPSPLVLELAEERAGRPLDYSTLEGLDCVERVPLRRTQLPEPLPVLGLDELDTAAVLGLPAGAARAYVRGLGEFARRGWMLDHLRNQVARFTSADGMISGRAARAALAARFASPSFSATQLANYATCPFRYFMRQILRIEPLDHEERREPSSLEIGRLAHQILERFYAQMESDGRALEDVGDTELAARLHAVETPLFQELETQGRTGARLLWSMAKQRLAEDLRQFLRAERGRETGGFRPVEFEAWFGRGGPRTAAVRTPEGETIALHGSIDRLDARAADDAVRVVDYKTGRLRSTGRDPGATQLAVYLWAATGGDAQRLVRSEGRLVSVTRRGGFAARRLAGSAVLERRTEFARLVGGVAAAIRAGWFFPVPGPGADHCKICDYASLCEARVAEQSERKARASAQVRGFFELPDFSENLQTLPGGYAAPPEEPVEEDA